MIVNKSWMNEGVRNLSASFIQVKYQFTIGLCSMKQVQTVPNVTLFRELIIQFCLSSDVCS